MYLPYRAGVAKCMLCKVATDDMQDSLKYDKSPKSPMPTYTWCPVSLVYLACMAYRLAAT